MMTQSEQHYTNETATVEQVLYGLPKTHKPGNPMRPIISAVGSFNHEAAKWLSNILASLRHHSTAVRDTFSFVKEIRKDDVRGCVIASFDVKSLFTNIPLKFTTNLLIIKSLFHDGCTQFQGISQTQIKKLLKWICQSTTFQFNGKFYKQIDGVAMGWTIAPLLADVIMNYVIDQALTKNNVQNKPIVLWRYVDDIFVAFNDMSSLNIFFNALNNVHNNITFTKELECGDSLAHLDVLIEKSQTGIQTTYRKPTHSGIYTHWTSFIPHYQKRVLVFGLLERAYKIASAYNAIHNEFMKIKSMLIKSVYPKAYIDRCIMKYLNPKHEAPINSFSKNRQWQPPSACVSPTWGNFLRSPRRNTKTYHRYAIMP